MRTELLYQTAARLNLPNDSIQTGTDNGWSIERSMVIGRVSADIILNFPQISRRHVRVTPGSDWVTLTDLGSRNGTAINGELIDGNPVPLHDGDQITLAGVVQLEFRDPLATPVAPRIGKLRGLWIDTTNDAVWLDAKRLDPPLARRQLRLLQLVSDAKGELVSRDSIASHVWPESARAGVSDDAIDSLVKRLKRRLKEIAGSRAVVQVIRGRGVRLQDDR